MRGSVSDVGRYSVFFATVMAGMAVALGCSSSSPKPAVDSGTADTAKHGGAMEAGQGNEVTTDLARGDQAWPDVASGTDVARGEVPSASDMVLDRSADGAVDAAAQESGSTDGAAEAGSRDAICPDGPVVARCTCGGIAVTSGYCCGNQLQDLACGPAGPIDMTLLPPDRRTTWNPGVPGGIPADGDPTRPATVWLPSGDPYDGFSVDPALGNDSSYADSAINAAIQSAGEAASASSRRIVRLAPGTYRLNNSILLNRSHVVLRGAGRKLTRLVQYARDEPVIFSGWPEFPDAAVDIISSVSVGSTSITVASARDFHVGDIIQIDQLDDPSYVFLYDAFYYKRAPGWNNNGPVSPGGYRSVTSLHEVTAISGPVLTIDPPTRIFYEKTNISATDRRPQAWVVNPQDHDSGMVRWTGIEDLYVSGGQNNSLHLEVAAYSWIKGVESDGSTTTGRGNVGDHISLNRSFRCEIREAYVHHATEIVQGGGAYGICLNASTSDCLVEDSIAVYLNKAVQTNVSGGGNVFAYNYIDNIRTGSDNWMEGAANGSHQSFSHHDLWEGNWATNIGTDATHGSSGWLTYLRNFAAGRCADATYAGNQTANLRAAYGDAWTREMTYVGNVLHAHAYQEQGTVAPVYEISSHTDPWAPNAIWRFGDNEMRGGGGTFDSEYPNPGPNETDPEGFQPPAATYTTKAIDMLWRHGNWDNVTNSIADWQGGTTRTLPNSFFRTSKPPFFSAEQEWPWVDPMGATAAERLKVLPAKARYDAESP